ncbi:hypothetical protein ACHRVW_00720 [Flavobacterium collinsii]|jgi:hypothetical protein|uniref:Uncharacterized protein n=1 Tax=Flavobacterium collinsii TaxID=1114861 RepID=A0A9W4X2E4_9FLAO|nr:hypothetical protein [Flavobacterium collinsii]GIQ60469.1 hypothetical protein Flavo103_36050 [Flavobacterium collinsii]CAA9196446.1 hypothetical protein FLACOL7796_01174 [Flavobacterium collinsii]CAI2765838.1 conserved protein of unknown function [Flavobacterium collinsii]
MKTTSISVTEKVFNFVFVFAASVGLGYSLVNQFVLDKPNKELLLVMICLFFASMASWQRKKYSKS